MQLFSGSPLETPQWTSLGPSVPLVHRMGAGHCIVGEGDSNQPFETGWGFSKKAAIHLAAIHLAVLFEGAGRAGVAAPRRNER
jgi:hypothetical protein